MKIYVAGAGGMLGKAIYDRYTDYDLCCSDKDVNEEWLSYLDFTDIDRYAQRVYEFKPDILFHIGALTDLEYCEKNPDDAYLNNVIGTENAVLIANKLDIPIVYISTAGIFDGEKEEYDDWDIPNPTSVYGKTKYLGEKYVVENAKKYYVFRAGWMMGGHDKDKKFVKKILDQLEGGAKEIFAVDDKSGSPTYTNDFVFNIRVIILYELYGVYNMCGIGSCSRLSVAREIVRLRGYDVKVTPVDSYHFSDEYSAPRPTYEALVSKKLELRKLNMMHPWKESLKKYLDDRTEL